MEDDVLEEMQDDVAVIRLNRPKVLNAWTKPMRTLLADLIAKHSASEATKAIVLTGAGNRGFCAGQDLNEGKSLDSESNNKWNDEWRHLYNTLRRCPKPTIVALNGLAAGSGFQFTMLADIRVGHAGVRLGQPEINQGIISGLGFWIIKENLGHSRAVELVLSGRLMDAEECYRLGLIHHLVPEDEVFLRSVALARELGSKAALALRLNKARICQVTQPGLDDALEAARVMGAQSFGSGEARRYMEQFLARRS